MCRKAASDVSVFAPLSWALQPACQAQPDRRTVCRCPGTNLRAGEEGGYLRGCPSYEPAPGTTARPRWYKPPSLRRRHKRVRKGRCQYPSCQHFWNGRCKLSLIAQYGTPCEAYKPRPDAPQRPLWWSQKLIKEIKDRKEVIQMVTSDVETLYGEQQSWTSCRSISPKL